MTPSLPTRTRGRATRSATFDQVFDVRCNSLNALRVAFAAFVVVGHGYHLGPDLSAPHIGSFYIHDVGVDGFFVISGFLITNSRLRPGSTTWGYLRDRGLRIFPAYWLCLIVCAVVITPLLLLKAKLPVSHAFIAPNNAFGFILKNSFLLQLQHGVAGMPSAGPVTGVLNGSLWTLFYEFFAYLAIAAIAWHSLITRRPAVVIIAFALCWLVLLAVTASPTTMFNLTGSAELVPRGSRLGVMFMSGAVLRIYWHRIPCSRNLALLSAVVVLASAPLNQPRLLAAPFLAYVVLFLGTRRTFQHVGKRVDISYGLYLYAWPIQQVLRAYNVQRHGLTLFLALSLGLASIAGALSYLMIERPALALKRRPRTRNAQSSVVDLNGQGLATNAGRIKRDSPSRKEGTAT